PKATYHKASLWLALVKAEVQAGVPHLARRAMHGFRRRVAGDILEATRDAKLALDYIGDTDLRQASRYLQPRDVRMEEAADIIDGAGGRVAEAFAPMTGEHPLATSRGEPKPPSPAGPKPSTNRQRMPASASARRGKAAGTAFSEQARQESNLQPPHVTPDFTPAKSRKSSSKTYPKSRSPKQKRPKTTLKPSTNRQRGRRS